MTDRYDHCKGFRRFNPNGFYGTQIGSVDPEAVDALNLTVYVRSRLRSVFVRTGCGGVANGLRFRTVRFGTGLKEGKGLAQLRSAAL